MRHLLYKNRTQNIRYSDNIIEKLLLKDTWMCTKDPNNIYAPFDTEYEEECAWIRYRKNKNVENRNYLVNKYLWFLVWNLESRKFINSYRNFTTDIAFDVCAELLIACVDNFDMDVECTFEQYFLTSIIQKLKSPRLIYINDDSRTSIVIPNNINERCRYIFEYYSSDVKLRDVCEYGQVALRNLGFGNKEEMTVGEFEEFYKSYFYLISLNSPTNDELDYGELLELIEDNRTNNVAESNNIKIFSDYVKYVVIKTIRQRKLYKNRLQTNLERDINIFLTRLGIETVIDSSNGEITPTYYLVDKPKTLESIAYDIGTTRERVRQINDSIKKIVLEKVTKSDVIDCFSSLITLDKLINRFENRRKYGNCRNS